ncbi:hypothetical protein OHA40_23615 [Nocardia sp. NBC_00508]|uniref:hypothetical protein n=1 Tax=Nocardia sp. NBC_00508 TaxID=2975992 RepID=UPI002E805885|nr:hypothetical protein [Nocardia sp. NBC_00508]WUD64656.1 hypothetical protein OHA40_23615 [Nocardia sp. NBC_00508]
MKLSWLALPALLAVTAAGCSDDTPASEVSTSTSAIAAASGTATTTAARDHDEPGGVVRVLLGDTKKIAVPADAVLDIRAPAAWGQAANGIRCTVTDSSGRNEDLRSSDVKKIEMVGGTEWMTLWTFSSAPNGDVTVACKDSASKIAAAHPHPYLRVVPRGIVPIPPPNR